MKNSENLININLWEQILEGNREAFSQLFRKYYTPLLNYGLRLTSDETLIKDAIQEVFIEIWDKREDISSVKYVRSYLYISVRRMIYRQVEIKKSRGKRDHSYIKENPDIYENHHESIIHENFEEIQYKEELRSAIEKLSQREKETIFLKYYGGFSNKEIAEIIDVNMQSVYNYIYRATERLKKEIRSSDADF